MPDNDGIGCWSVVLGLLGVMFLVMFVRALI